MTATAILMLLIAAVIVWGGLLASVVFIRKNPEVADLADPDDADAASGPGDRP